MKKALPAFLLLLAVRTGIHAQSDPTSRSWNQPVEPYRIAGNLYYVGASDVTSFLIATRKGHILLDSGFPETVPQIRENVKKLGFKMEDVKILLNSHAHYDHAGGLAALKEITGAKLAASAADAEQLARGGKDDPHIGNDGLFPAIRADRILKDGDTVSLGGTTLTAHLTPGHTRGCTTWTMKVKDGEKTEDVVFVCSTSVLPGVRLTDNKKYPQVGTDYGKTFQTLKALPCDIFLAPHASFYDGLDKAARLREGAKENPFVDPEGYRKYVEKSEKRYLDLLQAEREAAKKAP
jgi:metallo-beta-lactamase class B